MELYWKRGNYKEMRGEVMEIRGDGVEIRELDGDEGRMENGGAGVKVG